MGRPVAEAEAVDLPMEARMPLDLLVGQRRLLSPGATGVISTRKRPDPGDDWPGDPIRAKPLKIVAIALANRMARTVWAMPRPAETWRAACADEIRAGDGLTGMAARNG